jgi:stage II sporulation protein D
VRAVLRAASAGLLLQLLATSCAPLPPPRPAPPPPVAQPEGEQAPTVVQEREPTPEATRPRGEPTIDVGLAWDLETIQLSAGRDVFVGTSQDGETVRCAGVLRVVRSGGNATFANQTRDGRVEDEGVVRPGDTLWVARGDVDRPGDGPIGWNGKSWRGGFKVFLNPRGRLSLAVRLPLETYLLGVVPGEIGGLTPDLIEAGRAQAIAARSYTLFYRGRRASEGFDLYGTVEDQVYGSVETERPLATRCVEQTSGRVALYDGRPIRANYCSTCGGVSAEVWEAWPAVALPYLESARDGERGTDFCAASPQYRWRERWSEEEFLGDIERFGPALKLRLPSAGLGDLVDVRADARSRSGRVWRLLVRTTTGDVTIPAYAIRGVLRRGGNPDAILRSTLFKIDVRRHPATGRAMEVLASGAGSGHGVGLCQTGALGMARAGARAEEILQHYYPHIALERLY